ncbi:MAG TPA: dephospho-CoA kinase [Candidatus Binatia bacterium]|nr:dephospho-CoA kinase [Candidatus Binatia bacterium]
MKLIGLTGGIASGKSTVAAILRRLGAAIVNADELAREVVQPGTPGWKEIVEAFGAEALQADQTVDRQKLRTIVFNNPETRKKLEAIIHPRVRALAQKRIQEHAASGSEIVVYEVPLLFEGNLQASLRPVVLVAADVATQKRRLRERDGLAESEAEKHITAQMSLEEKRRLADYVIENEGNIDHLERQVKEVLARIKAT